MAKPAALEIKAASDAGNRIRFTLTNKGDDDFIIYDGFLPELQVSGPCLQFWIVDERTMDTAVPWRSSNMFSVPSNPVTIRPGKSRVSEFDFRLQMRDADWDQLPPRCILFWEYRIPAAVSSQSKELKFYGGFPFQKSEVKSSDTRSTRNLPTEDLIRVLSQDWNRGPRPEQIDALLGPPDKVEPSSQWKDSRLKTYALSDDRRLETTIGDKGRVYLVVIVTEAGNHLVYK